MITTWNCGPALGWKAWVSASPGCMTIGRTEAEAVLALVKILGLLLQVGEPHDNQ